MWRRGEPVAEAYHGEIGREATASTIRVTLTPKAYHGEIGREATASTIRVTLTPKAYHGEIGREATALRSVLL